MINQNQSYLKGCKKAIAVISLLCLLFAFLAVTASASSTSAMSTSATSTSAMSTSARSTTAKVTVSSLTAERDATASVSFNLEGNPGIWGIKLRIHYDHSVLTLKSVTTGSVFEKGELTLSQNLDKDPYVVVASGNSLENKTANGTIVTLNFTVSSTAEFKAYPVTVEVSQANNVDGNKISFTSVDGSVTVVSCIHANTEWRVTKAASCEENGTETLTCKKCEKTFETRTVNATGHQNTEVRNVVAATKTSEGYTGDTYCKTCGKLISKGQTIAKLKDTTQTTNPPTTTKPETTKPTTTKPATTKPATTKPATTKPTTQPETTAITEASTDNAPIITSGNEAIFDKNSQEPLVFISDADFSEFLYVEIDGNALSEKDFTAKSGSTVITINTDYLNKLSSGEHTVSIVSKGGTATAKFTVKDPDTADTTDMDITDIDTTNPPETDSTDKGDKSSSAPIIIAVIIVVILAGGAAAFLVIKKRRG